MRIAITAPNTDLAAGVRSGNRVTALRWALILRKLGHRVRLAEGPGAGTGPDDLLVALHAVKSAAAVRAFHGRGPIAVAVTGTDVFLPAGPGEQALEVLGLADRVIALQPRALDVLPPDLRRKGTVLFQSVASVGSARAYDGTGPCRAIALGHLRPVKAPLLAARALEDVDAESRLELVHYGAALDPELGRLAALESRRHPRWRWGGAIPRRAVLERLLEAHVYVSSSDSEGGSGALSESLACGLPILASAVPGNLGLLGDDHPGAFAAGDAAALRELLVRFERDGAWRAELVERTRSRASLIAPERECAGWRGLLADLSR